MWGLLIFVIGIAYGFFSHGRQDKGQLFKTGLLIGLVLAIVFGLLGGLTGLGLPGGFLGIFISALILTILFVVGVWIGDLIEGPSRRATNGRRP
jgi:hypothetical protein